MEKLVTVNSKMEANLIIGLLENNGIKAYSNSNGAGEYLNILANVSTLGENIYVNESDLENALCVIKILEEEPQDTESEELQDTDSEEEIQMHSKIDKVKRLRSIVAGVILFFLGVSIIYGLFQ